MGSSFAFIFAWAAVKVFLRIVISYGFRHFGYYRIALGALFLALAWWFNLPLYKQ